MRTAHLDRRIREEEAREGYLSLYLRSVYTKHRSAARRDLSLLLGKQTRKPKPAITLYMPDQDTV